MSSDVSLGQAHEAEVTLRKAGATVENFWDPISKKEELAGKIMAFVIAALKPVFRLVIDFDYDKHNDGWKLLSDSATKEGEFEPELAEFHKEGENFVGGEEMLVCAQAMSDCTGQRHAEAMLRDPLKIPEKWKKYALVFTDTVWQDSDGHHYVACLRWYGDVWYLDFGHLGVGFGSFGRLCRFVRLRRK
jgi:hypothetical protein